MDFAEYKKLKEKIDEDHRNRLAALEMVWDMSKQNASSDVPGKKDEKMTLSNTFRKIIEGLSGEFTADDIQQGLVAYGLKGIDRLSITNTLFRLYKRNEISLAKKGAGRSPSRYRKTESQGIPSSAPIGEGGHHEI